MALLGVAASEGTGEKAIFPRRRKLLRDEQRIDRSNGSAEAPSFIPSRHLSGARVKAPRQESAQSLGSGEK